MPLFRKPWESKNPAKRKKAVEDGSVTEQGILIALAKTDPDRAVRKAAEQRITDRNIRAEIAKSRVKTWYNNENTNKN